MASKYYKVTYDGRIVRAIVNADLKDEGGHSDGGILHHDIKRHFVAGRNNCRRIGHVESVLDVFGGTGIDAINVQDYIKPNRHELWDCAPNSIDSLLLNVGECDGVKIVKCDVYEQEFEEFDVIMADYHKWTAHKAFQAKDKQVRPFTDKIFQHAKKFVCLTDCGIFGVLRFEKNRRSYAKSWLGEDKDIPWEQYYQFVADSVAKTYGFGLISVQHWSNAAACLFQRGVEADFVVEKVEEDVKVKTIKIIDMSRRLEG